MQQIWIPPRSNFLYKVIAVEGNLWRNSVENKCILYMQQALAWKGSFEEPIFLATLVALHFTLVSKSVSQWVSES